MAPLPKFFQKRLDELDAEALVLKGKDNPTEMVSVAVGYNDLANQVNYRDEPERLTLFRDLKLKAAQWYEKVWNAMKMSDAAVMSALFYLQGGNPGKAKKLVKGQKGRKKQSKKGLGASNPIVINIVLKIIEDRQSEARDLMKSHRADIDPLLREVLENTLEIVFS